MTTFEDVILDHHGDDIFGFCYDDEIDWSEEVLTSIYLTLFFHDVIYDPQKSNNEEMSVTFFKKTLGKELPESIVDLTKSYILSTKSHQSFDWGSKVVSDCDLAILGEPKEKFEEYELKIRQEYSFVSEEDYLRGRGLIMQKFAKQKELYHTPYFKINGYNFRAQCNLTKYKL